MAKKRKNAGYIDLSLWSAVELADVNSDSHFEASVTYIPGTTRMLIPGVGNAVVTFEFGGKKLRYAISCGRVFNFPQALKTWFVVLGITEYSISVDLAGYNGNGRSAASVGADDELQIYMA